MRSEPFLIFFFAAGMEIWGRQKAESLSSSIFWSFFFAAGMQIWGRQKAESLSSSKQDVRIIDFFGRETGWDMWGLIHYCSYFCFYNTNSAY